MRLACYNVENLFNRATAMNMETWAEGRVVLERFAKLNKLLGEPVYTTAMKATMVQLLTELGLDRNDSNRYVILRQNRGRLVTRGAAGLTIRADSRFDWSGSLELQTQAVNEVAMQNTARVMLELQADVLAVIEAESRPALVAFNEQVVAQLGPSPYQQIMLIDGNDERGIDVGLLAGNGTTINRVRSHVDDTDGSGRKIFSRDCPEYEVINASGQRILVLVNHLKSKGFGSTAANNARRQVQAQRIADLYRELVAAGEEHIAVVGDLNDTPGSAPLAPLLTGTDLQDAFGHPSFDNGGYPGTYGSCTASNKIDYLLLSPALYAAVTSGGIVRKAMWPGVRPVKWPVYPELTREIEAGSDHAALWVDLNI